MKNLCGRWRCVPVFGLCCTSWAVRICQYRAEDTAAVLEEGCAPLLQSRSGDQRSSAVADGSVDLRHAAMPGAHSEPAGFCRAGNLNLHAAATVLWVEPSRSRPQAGA